MEQALVRHLKQNVLLYVVVGTFFLGGIVVGAMVVLLMGEGQQLKLAAHLDNLLQQLIIAVPQPGAVAVQAALKGLREIGLLWFLGLTIIGAPLIVIVIFTKGFILGFTVAFLVQEKSLQGVVLSLFSILPSNLLRVPALFLAGILALTFCLNLAKGSIALKGSFMGQLMVYSLLMGVLVLAVMGSGLIEAYLTPPLVRIILNYF